MKNIELCNCVAGKVDVLISEKIQSEKNINSQQKQTEALQQIFIEILLFLYSANFVNHKGGIEKGDKNETPETIL